MLLHETSIIDSQNHCCHCWYYYHYEQKAMKQTAFKCEVSVYKFFHGSAPSYIIAELCHVTDVEVWQWLCFSSLIVSQLHWLTTVGNQAFWSLLLMSGTVCLNTSPRHPVADFQSRVMKTHLFCISSCYFGLTYYRVTR